MGKGKKRKNPGVGVDFRKVKHKVGKKLPKAQNDTRTDFQARSINLPNQSITQDKTGAAVSERNQTVKELVSQLSHHNTSTRRDALIGLQQLTTAHPAEARRHTALLLEALAPRLSDGEPSVRAALLTMLRGAVLPTLGPSALSPFMPLLMAHVSAALTNLSADVRLDGLAVLEALTEAAPQLMAQQQQLGAALGHYAGLLSRANRGTSVKSQALTGLLKVVGSLDKFLQASLGAASTNTNSLTATAAAVGETEADGRVLCSGDGGGGRLLRGTRVAPAHAAAGQMPSASRLLQLYCPGFGADTELGSISSGGGKQQQQQQPSSDKATSGAGSTDGNQSSSSSKQLQEHVLLLLGVLFDCWAEAAPGSLSTAPDQESAQVLVHILHSTQTLLKHFGSTAAATQRFFGSSLGGTPGTCGAGGLGFNTQRDQEQWVQQAAAVVLPRMVKVFPVTPPATQSLSGALTDLLLRFNLYSMQLLAQFMAAGVGTSAGQRQQQQGSRHWEQQQQTQGGAVPVQPAWQLRLLEFMAAVLTTGSCLPHLEQTAAAGAGGRSSGTSSNKEQQQQRRRQPQGAAVVAAATTAGGAGTGSSSSSLSSSTMMVAVLQSLHELLPELTGTPRALILAAVGQLAAAAAAAASTGNSADVPGLSTAAAGAAASNAVRSACLKLQLSLMLQHLTQVGCRTPQTAEAAAAVAEEERAIAAWLSAAPQILYQLGVSKPKISQLLLQLLFEATRLSTPGLIIEQQLQSMQPQLAALMATALPPAAAKQTNQQQQQQRTTASGSAVAPAPTGLQPVRVLLGPLAQLPPSCQSLACDALSHLQQVTPPLLKAAALCCRLTSFPDDSVQRLLDGLLSGAASSMTPEVYFSFVATLLSPGPVGGYVERASKRQLQSGLVRHQQLVDAVSRWLHCYGPVGELLQVLAVKLLQQWQQQVVQQQDGAAGAAAAQQRQVCCLSYSILAVAALGAGCWQPSTSSSSTAAAPGAIPGVSGPGVQSCSIPSELLLVLPGVLATHVSSRASSSADGFAAEASVERCMQQLVLPLCHTLPSSNLLLPFVQQLVDQGVCAGQQQAELRVTCHVLKGLLSQRALRAVWLESEAQLQPLLKQLEDAAQQLQEQSGDGSVLSEVQQLQTGLAVMCR